MTIQPLSGFGYRALALSLALQLITTPLAAQRADDWRELANRLKTGTPVTITTSSGETVAGTFKSANASALVLDTPDEPLPGRPHLMRGTPDRVIAFSEIRTLSYEGGLKMTGGTRWAIVAGIAGFFGAVAAFAPIMVVLGSR